MLLSRFVISENLGYNYITRLGLNQPEKNDRTQWRGKEIRWILCAIKSNGYEYILSLIENNKISEIECSEPDFASELENRTIIDITGDQFRYSEEFLYYKVPVYVGPMDEMHHIFSIDNVHECTGLSGIGTHDAKRMHSLYSIIKQFL